MQKNGTPKNIAARYDPSSQTDQLMPFECSLCRMCAVVCPVKLNPADMFLEMRRESVDRKAGKFSNHDRILNYEKRGTSQRYTYYALPAGCDTILFPGCTLPGTRPDKVTALFDLLQKAIPSLGIVFDCCTKPSHDLGREKFFHAMFDEMKEYLMAHGVKNVLVACPNCYRVFRQYGGSFAVKTVYEHLAETRIPQISYLPLTVTVHDPCGTRYDEQIHTAVRQLIAKYSLEIKEMKHHRLKTICCGEGGSVGCLSPELAKTWGARRNKEAEGMRIITYCAGCANFLGTVNPTNHILDLLFDPEATMAGNAKVSKAPFTYLNRLRLKRLFKRKLQTAKNRERNFFAGEEEKRGLLKHLTFLITMVPHFRRSA